MRPTGTAALSLLAMAGGKTAGNVLRAAPLEAMSPQRRFPDETGIHRGSYSRLIG